MKKETTLRLLNKFVDYTRTNMNKPFSQDLKIGKYLCATDAKIVVLVPETEEIKIENDEGYKPPNINGILPDFTDKIDFDFSYLKELFDGVPTVERFKMEECEACDGDGKFEHYGDWYDCKNCGEHGEVQTNIKEKVKSPETAFRFKDVLISVSKIKSIMDIQFALQKNEFEFKIMKLGKGIVWFKLDEIYIGIAALHDIEDDKKDWTIIDVKL